MRSRKRWLLSGALVVALALSLSPTASAAHPAKRGSYVGNLKGTSTRTGKRLLIKVSRSGKTASARLGCTHGSGGTIKRFKIRSSGRFTALKGKRSFPLWRLRGRFTSRSKIKAKLFVKAACDGRGGSLTLQLQGKKKKGKGAPAEDTHPKNPIPFSKDTVFTLNSPQTNYWVYVPGAYDATHNTPITLFVWSHGCGGTSEGDISTVSPGGSQSYIAIAVGGREGACWDPNTDSSKLLAAIADIETHFNIDRHRVVIGGYSSGGDLSYRTAFYNSTMFAGLLAENTTPFRDTGSSQSASLAAAKFKFHVVHLAHTEDEEYPIDTVRQETDAMKAAGFPIERVELPGHHFDADTDTTGSDHDLRAVLLPHLNDGWRSP